VQRFLVVTVDGAWCVGTETPPAMSCWWFVWLWWRQVRCGWVMSSDIVDGAGQVGGGHWQSISSLELVVGCEVEW
jgi:hypothetical protein